MGLGEVQAIGFCVRIGSDPLLVQGAGGNVSWKDNNALWVKASGKWLEDAGSQPIFVAVDRDYLCSAMKAGEFDIKPRLMGYSELRPSIETLLHALMPHPVVVHVHAVEILACLVRVGCEDEIAARMDPAIRYAIIDYFMPGAELATAVSDALKRNSGLDILFLKNHGIVIGGADFDEVSKTLTQLTDAFRHEGTAPLGGATKVAVPKRLDEDGYCNPTDLALHLLSQDEHYVRRLSQDWALYPDHLVFLGSKAAIFLHDVKKHPSFVFLPGIGTFMSESATKAQQVQLRCYFEVLRRQKSSDVMRSLTRSESSALLDWDAEKYRQEKSR